MSDGRRDTKPRSNGSGVELELFVHVPGATHRVELRAGAVLVDGQPMDVALDPHDGAPTRRVRVGDRWLRLRPRHLEDGSWLLHLDGLEYQTTVLDRTGEAVRKAKHRTGGAGGPSPLVAPMPGMVVRIDVHPGQLVEKGDGLVIVEAMKMENELRAGQAARVLAVHADEGSAVEKGQVLVEFEAVEEEP